MPIFIHLANIVIKKKAVARKYEGGIAQFRKDFTIGKNEDDQEDAQLFSWASMNFGDFDFSKLVNKGFDYDEANVYSDDFVLVSRYGGPLWDAKWLEILGSTYAWHIDNQDNKERLHQTVNMTMNVIEEEFEKGNNPFLDPLA